jgi:VanZ family protein
MQKLKKWYPAIIVMLVIFIVSSIPGKIINDSGLGKESYHINGHFILFLILTLTYYKATKNVLRSMIFSILYALLDELHQKFTPLRSVSMFDIYVDTIGTLIGGIILWKKQLLPDSLKNWLEN